MTTQKRFARIITTQSGEEVLYYVEPDAGDYRLHQIAMLNGFQADLALGFTSPDEDENERKAFAALDSMKPEHAERLLAIIRELGLESEASDA